MTFGRLCCGAFLAFVLAAPAFAQPAPALKIVSEGAYAPAGARQFMLHSERVGRDFVVVVSAPSGPFVQAGQRLPTIYALDAGYGVSGPPAQMMAWAGAMSPAYVVSVGYPEGQTDQRNTDLLHRPVTQDGVTFGGGGAAFQAFLTQELRPFLEARYPLDPGKTILFGHSYGGLFAANVLAEVPEAFSGYVIASPSVWADPQLLAKLATAAPKGKGWRVFVAVGEKEESRMVEGAGQVATTLAAAGSTFTVDKRVFAGENHISYYPMLVPAAFVWILPPPAAPLVKHTAIVVAPEALERLAGVYALVDGRTVTVTCRQAKLFAELTGSPGGEVLAESPQRFFAAPLPGFDVMVTFEAGASGRPSALVLSINGVEMRAVRRTQ